MKAIIKEPMSYFANTEMGEIISEWMHADFFISQDASLKARNSSYLDQI